jgi:hypothetical protein
MADAAACGALRAAGNAHFGAGAYADAAASYGSAADAAAALLAARPADAAAARELALALNNRAACHLQLRDPLRALDDTADAASACLRPGGGAREWQRALRSGAWAPEAYAKVLLRRAAACEAAGAPLAGLPGVLFAATAAPQPHLDTARTLARRLTSDALHAPSPPPGCALRGQWRRLRVDGSSGAPPARRHAAAAALDGFFYVFGGECPHSFEALGDAWRLPLRCGGATGAPSARWERLRSPGGRGGPPPCRAPAAFASAHRHELFVAASDALFAYTPESEDGVTSAKWRRVGNLFTPSPKGYGDENTPSAAMALSRDAFFTLRFCEDDVAAPPLLLRLGLDDGRLTRVTLPRGALAPAARESAHMWHDDASCGDGGGGGDGRLLLWGGTERAEDGRVPGHPECLGDVPLNELWQLTLSGGGDAGAAGLSGVWRRLPRDGGGMPLPPRAEAALVPLRDASHSTGDASHPPGAAGAIVFGGYSELLPVYLRNGCMAGYRYLADAHVYLPGSTGWLPVHFGSGASERGTASSSLCPSPAAQAGLVHDAASGRVFVAGGYAGEHAASYGEGGVWEALVEGVCGDQTPFAPPPSAPLRGAAAPAPAEASSASSSAAAAACAALRAGPFSQLPPLLSPSSRPDPRFRAATPSSFDALLTAALATRRQPHTTWHTSWTCTFAGAAAQAAAAAAAAAQAGASADDDEGTSASSEDSPFSFLFSVHGDFSEQPPPAPGGPLSVPPRYAEALRAEPTPADVAWGILAAITPALSQNQGGGGGARGLNTPSFTFPVFRPGALLFAARMAHTVDALRPLLEALSIEAVAESWPDAAESALSYDTCPWGYNAPGSMPCLRCRARGVKLRRCGGCERARYCGPECAKADWRAGHREMCAVLKASGSGAGGSGSGSGR